MLLPILVACPAKRPAGTAPVTPTVGTPATPPASPTPTVATPCAPLVGGQDSFVQLVDVRVGTHDTFDRLTFEFRPTPQGPKMPKYQIDPAKPPFSEDASGQAIQVDGNFFARIIFHGASGFDLAGETPRPTYTGRKEIKPRFDVLVEAQETGDFEATLSWVLGMSRSSCWTARELEDPLRLVVDLPH